MKILTFNKQIQITEACLKHEIKRFMDLYNNKEANNNNNDIEIIFDPIHLIYESKICEQGVDFMRFKPKSSHKDYSDLIYTIRFIIQFSGSDLYFETIHSKFLRMYQIFKLIYQGEIPKLDTKNLGIIYLK